MATYDRSFYFVFQIYLDYLSLWQNRIGQQMSNGSMLKLAQKIRGVIITWTFVLIDGNVEIVSLYPPGVIFDFNPDDYLPEE